MVVGIAKLEFFLPENGSLKEKRRILNAIKEKTFQKFRIPVSEVGFQDLWQRAEIGFCVPGSDRRLVSELLEKITDFVEGMDLGQVTQKTVEVIDF